MSNKFFHYSTNQEVEQYLSELTQQCGFKHKTQLINTIFNGEVLTVQSDDLTLHNNQSALFKRNAQQLLDLDTQLRVHLPDTNPIDFDISQYQSIEDKIAAAEEQARRYYMSQVKGARRSGQKINEVEWCFGYEGMLIDV